MIESYLTGLASIVALALGWVAVQSAWARVFAAEAVDPDALARPGCQGCGCGVVCQRRAGAARTQENPQ